VIHKYLLDEDDRSSSAGKKKWPERARGALPQSGFVQLSFLGVTFDASSDDLPTNASFVTCLPGISGENLTFEVFVAPGPD